MCFRLAFSPLLESFLSEPSTLIVSKVTSDGKLFGAVTCNIDSDERQRTL